jgi:SAM-dependent methyltransferase
VSGARFLEAGSIDAALGSLLGRGTGVCLEIGCRTGVHAGRVRGLGWTPLGIDISTGMLRYTHGRLPAARADAARLPVRDGCLPAVITVMAYTAMPAYPAVLAEASRVLQPGGRFVNVGVPPCFCEGFADRSNPAAVVIWPRLPGRPLDQGVLDHRRRPGQGRPHSPSPCPASRTPS